MEEIEEIVEDKVRTRTIRKLTLLVAFTAIMLIGSTYAWFSTQKNVTLGGIQGIVNVAEGLQISLDAKTWKNEIDFGDFTENADGDLVSSTYLPGATLQQPYITEYEADGTTPKTYATNVIPEELLRVSTTASINEGIGSDHIPMYWGENTDAIKLGNIQKMNEEPESGYIAIDVFLQNTSAATKTVDLLQLETNSSISLLGGTEKETTGLQNTVRVAMALYDNTNVKVNDTPTTEQIIAATTGQNIIDVAIWEPNANAHVQYVVDSNNYITWNTTDAEAIYGTGAAVNTKFGLTTQMPTYGLTSGSTTATYTPAGAVSAVTGIADIYDWSDTGVAESKVAKQYTLQTTTAGISEPTQLVSAKDGTTEFSIAAGEYHKVRLYIWLEGQDVDCINYASLGGGIELDFGFSKGSTDGESGGATTAGTYLPTGFSEVEGTTLATGLTIEDSVGNQYVWVEVPQTTTVYPTAGLSLDLDSLTGEELTTAYNTIENDLHTYTSVYRNGTTYTDTWYSEEQHGFASADEYNALKNKMLKSVYQNGGFYVGRYEAGTATARESEDDELTTPVIKANAYPYNYVTCSQAQSLASTKFATGGYTTSLMFGIQWELVMKYLETKGTSQSELNSDSIEWGNYYYNTYNITNQSAKYYRNSWLDAPYNKTELSEILLTTGASSEFSKQNISDLAGNVFEWLLEYPDNETHPCSYVGSACGKYDDMPASAREWQNTICAGGYFGFRVSLY